jgi:hypothetical protein
MNTATPIPILKPPHSFYAIQKFTHPTNKVFPATIKSLFEAQVFTAATPKPNSSYEISSSRPSNVFCLQIWKQ